MRPERTEGVIEHGRGRASSQAKSLELGVQPVPELGRLPRAVHHEIDPAGQAPAVADRTAIASGRRDPSIHARPDRSGSARVASGVGGATKARGNQSARRSWFASGTAW